MNKSDKEVAEMAMDEIKLLQCIGKASDAQHAGSKHVLRLVGRGQRYIGQKLSNADKSAFFKLSAKLSISKTSNFEIIEKLSISKNASKFIR